MIVELTGCSAAGKSTLLAAILALGREHGLPLVTPADVLLTALPDALTTHPTAQNLAFDLSATRRRRQLRARYGKFLDFARATIRRDSDHLLTGLNAYRGVVRCVGIYDALADLADDERIVLVDEGTVHSAHNILAHVGRSAQKADINTFAQLAPLPDLLLSVTAPLETVLQRTATRADPPLRGRSPDATATFVRHAHAMFHTLTGCDRIARRTMRIENDGTGLPGDHARALDVVQYLARRGERPADAQRAG